MIYFTGYTRTTVMAEHEKQTPPGDLEVVRLFVNTLDVEDGSEQLADPAATAAWLVEHDLATPSDAFGPDDVARLTAFREALRTLLLSHHGEAVEPEGVAALEAFGAGAPLVVSFAPDGATRLEPALGGAAGAIGRLLAIVVLAEADGTWARMKACPADDCLAAFYDHSRNHSRTWCDMAVCGNRAKARTYRHRASRRGEA